MAQHHYILLVFDWDGTLIDSVQRIVTCYHACFEALRLTQPPETEVMRLIGLPLAEAFRTMFPDLDVARLPECVATYRRFWRDERLPLSPLFAGVKPMLVALEDQGYRLAVATGKSRGGLERDLEHHQVGHHFPHTRCALETRAKPDPEMLCQLMAATSSSPARTLMIGDTLLDLEMARYAGVDSVGVASGGQSCRQLAAARPRACLDVVTRLPEILDIGSGFA